MKRAISYARVSTQRQGNSGFGIDAQQIQIREFASARGYRIQKRFTDVHTGMSEDSIRTREGLQRALDLARRTGWPIFIADIDRLGRHERSMIDLVRDDPDITIIDANSGHTADEAILRGQAKRAEREGKMISKRTRKALKTLKTQGVKLGNLESLNKARASSASSRQRKATLRTLEYEPLIQEIRENGVMTAGEIAIALNQRGLRTARGEPWSADNIRRLLKDVDKLAKARDQEKRTKEKYANNPLHGAF
jgi:DNA invertase Pin-like site-specific DNA recombinase